MASVPRHPHLCLQLRRKRLRGPGDNQADLREGPGRDRGGRPAPPADHPRLSEDLEGAGSCLGLPPACQSGAAA